MTLNDALFAQSYNQIRDAILGVGYQNFQMFGAPRAFNWPLAPTGQIDPAAYLAVSVMPHWSPTAQYGSTDTRFFDAYAEVLSHVTFTVSPDRQADLKQLQDNVTAAANAQTKAESDMNQAYLAQKQNGGVVFAAKYPDINAWIDGPGTSYQQVVDDAKAAFQRATTLLLELQRASMPATLQQALDAIKRPEADPATSAAPRGWVKVPNGSGILEWAPDWQIGQQGQDFRAELSRGSIGAFEVQLSAADSTSDYQSSFAKANGSYGTPFWGVEASGGWQKMDLSTSDKSVQATVKVKSSTTVDVAPGAWYDGGFMRDLALSAGDGYTIVPPWTAKGGPHALFGPEGLLAASVSKLVVAYQPSFSITMSERTFQENRQKFEAAAGVRIGPFTFGGSGGHESDYKHATDGSTTFTGESTSTDPIIIGVALAFPGIDD
jgi:hypothetical protein